MHAQTTLKPQASTQFDRISVHTQKTSKSFLEENDARWHESNPVDRLLELPDGIRRLYRPSYDQQRDEQHA